MTALDIIGRQHDEMQQSYDALLSLLARVQTGEVQPEQIRVDLLGRSWRIVEAGIYPPPGYSPSQEERDVIEEVQEALLRRAQGLGEANGKES